MLAQFPRFATLCDKNGEPKGAKAPYTGNCFKAATMDADQIARWWSQWPNAVPGIPTGEASALSVIDGDIDRETGETIGESQIADLGPDHPDAVKVRTGSGGVQIIYRREGGARTSSKQAASNVVARGPGGFPRPIRLGKRAVGWRESHVNKWLKSVRCGGFEMQTRRVFFTHIKCVHCFADIRYGLPQ